MAKITLTDVSSGYLSTATYNANNTLIETAIENTLSRDGTSPNTMGANLDMNSNRITNVTDGTNNQDAVTVSQLNALSLSGGGGVTTISGLTDVDTTGSVDNDILYFDGAQWVDTGGLFKWDGTGYLSVETTGAGVDAGFYTQSAAADAYAYVGVYNTESGALIELQAPGSTNGGQTGITWVSSVESLRFSGTYHQVIDIADSAAAPTVPVITFMEGSKLVFNDSTDTDTATFYHDDTDFNTDFVTTTDWNITGVTAVNISGSPVVTEATATFNADWAGFDSAQASTVTYRKVGSMVTIMIPQLTATSNATSFTSGATDVPAAIRPTTSQQGAYIVSDNGTFVNGTIRISAAGQISFGGTNLVGTGGFTASGAKGFRGPQPFTYILD